MDAKLNKVLWGSLSGGLLLALGLALIPSQPAVDSNPGPEEQVDASEGLPSATYAADSYGAETNSVVPGEDASASGLAIDPRSGEFDSQSTTLSELPREAAEYLTSTSVSSEGGTLEAGDRLLRGGNYFGANQYYSKLLLQGDAGAGLSFRLGLSHELTGSLKQAAQHYQDAIRASEMESLPQLWSLIGLARVWIKAENYESANALLSEMLLRFGGEAYPETIRTVSSLMLAECIRAQFFEKEPTSSTLWPVYFSVSPNPDLQLSENDVRPVQGAIGDGTELSLVQMPGIYISGIVVDANVSGKLVTELIRDLGQLSGVQFQLSDRARAQLSGRTTSLQNRALSIAVWLDQLLAPFGLAWEQQDKNVFIISLEEQIKTRRMDYLLERRGRLLRDVQINASDKAMRCIALMHEGNDLLLSADFESAATRFQTARSLAPYGELNALLYFNNAVLQLKQDQAELALESFYNALDQSLDPYLKSRSYANIARLELGAGRADRAVSAASRGLRIVGEQEQTVENLLVLAKAYLLDGRPYAANQVLFKYSNLLRGKPEEALASVFGSCARLEITGPTAGLSNEANRLMRALAELPDSAIKDYADAILVSRAYRKVGLGAKSIEYMTQALASATNPTWQDIIRVELAEQYHAQGAQELAAAQIGGISNLEGHHDALLLKAKVELDSKRIEDCIASCKQLLQYSLDDEQKRNTLVTLGRAYQARGDDYAAATCFSGVIPEFDENP